MKIQPRKSRTSARSHDALSVRDVPSVNLGITGTIGSLICIPKDTL